MNTYNYRGLALLKNNGIEYNKVKLYCIVHDIPHKVYSQHQLIDTGYVPICGSVEWVELQLGKSITPDYYPRWLSRHLYRDVWECSECYFEQKTFIKPADRYKRFNGTIVDGYFEKESPPFVCSQVITFVDEFRYYITNGKVVDCGWYAGKQETIIPPEFNIAIPEYFCGAVDFGITDDGKFALVESQHPYACGWYTDDIKTYIQWCIDGWNYMIGE